MTPARMTENQPWTVLRLLQWTEDYLRQQGSETPRLDAEVLLATARGCQRIELYTAYDQVADEVVRQRFRELVRRRATGEPVAYLVGHREFYARDFHVTPDVLVPRPETEFVLIELLDKLDAAGKRETQDPIFVADVGTGSGILGVSVCLEVKQAQVAAIDVSPAALRVAVLNATKHGVVERLTTHQGDLLTGFPSAPTFDFVISNPPYVSHDEFAQLAPDIRLHEPDVALVAGPQGTEVIERLIGQAAERLLPGGWLITEISPMIEAAVSQALQGDGRYESIRIRRDFSQLPRVVAARRVA